MTTTKSQNGVTDLASAPIAAADTKYSISSYGADYPVDGLVKRLKNSDIEIPGFQRSDVWKLKQRSRFIESLLLGLPVPGIFLYREPDTRKLQVVDGQQRLRTLQYFTDEMIGESRFRLTGVCAEFENKTYSMLADEDRRRFDDSVIHATIFQQDQPTGDRGSVFEIFRRLNTGGTPLSAYEIRACVYRGPLIDCVKSLSELDSWRAIYGPPNPRGKDQDVILRYLALRYDWKSYGFRTDGERMNSFINRFLDVHRDASGKDLSQFEREFKAVADTAATMLGQEAFRPKRAFNIARAEAVLVGLANRLEHSTIKQPTSLKAAADRLFDDEDFHKWTSSQTSTKDYVTRRIAKAIATFGPVP